MHGVLHRRLGDHRGFRHRTRPLLGGVSAVVSRRWLGARGARVDDGRGDCERLAREIVVASRRRAMTPFRSKRGDWWNRVGDGANGADDRRRLDHVLDILLDDALRERPLGVRGPIRDADIDNVLTPLPTGRAL